MSQAAKASANSNDENFDDKILAQQEAIEKEIASQQPLVSEKCDVSSLSTEYLVDDTVYQQKVKDLSEKYKTMRKTRGDGNCFFRAFGYSYFEKLIGKQDQIQNFKNTITKLSDDLVKLGYCSFTVEDFRDVFIDVLDKLNTSEMNSEELLKIFCDSGISDYIVVFLRLIVSCYLQMNSDFFASFIEGYSTIKEFCSHEVEPMYRESDHIHVIALTKATNISVRIIYMDRGGQDKVVVHDFPEGEKPMVNILYRPGHYDILYE